MLIKYDGTELDAAIVNAILVLISRVHLTKDWLKRPWGFGDDVQEGLMAYQDFRTEYHKNSRIRLGGVRMPILAPGESINTVSAQRPNSNFAQFESAVLRNVAAGTGMSAQQISQNWAEVNYSSYRAAMLEAWKTFNRRRSFFSTGFCQPLFTAWLEEVFDVGNLPLPKGAPDFVQYRSLYGRCKWMGPGRGYVDDVKEKQGAILGMDAGLTTLEKKLLNWMALIIVRFWINVPMRYVCFVSVICLYRNGPVKEIQKVHQPNKLQHYLRRINHAAIWFWHSAYSMCHWRFIPVRLRL